MPSHRLKPAVATWSSPPPSLRKKTCCCPGLRGSNKDVGVFTETPPLRAVYLWAVLLHDCRMRVFLKHFPGYFPRASVASEGTSGPWASWIATGDQALYQLSYSASRFCTAQTSFYASAVTSQVFLGIFQKFSSPPVSVFRLNVDVGILPVLQRLVHS